MAEIYSVFGQGDALAKITEATGYDGFVKDDVYVVFNPTQIKSATDNIGTFDPENPDIRFSIADYSLDEQSDIIDILTTYIGTVVDKTPAEIAAFYGQVAYKVIYPFLSVAVRIGPSYQNRMI